MFVCLFDAIDDNEKLSELQWPWLTKMLRMSEKELKTIEDMTKYSQLISKFEESSEIRDGKPQLKIAMMVPFGDLFNHDSIHHTAQLLYNPINESVEILSNSNTIIKKNSQIFVSYGYKSNNVLLSQYGFILTQRPYNLLVKQQDASNDISKNIDTRTQQAENLSILIENQFIKFNVFLSRIDVNFGTKSQLLKNYNFVNIEIFSKKYTGLSWSAAKAIYIASLNKKYFDSFTIGKILSIQDVNIIKQQYGKNINAINFENDEMKRIEMILSHIDASFHDSLRNKVCQLCDYAFSQLENITSIKENIEWIRLREDSQSVQYQSFNLTNINALKLIGKYLLNEKQLYLNCISFYC